MQAVFESLPSGGDGSTPSFQSIVESLRNLTQFLSGSAPADAGEKRKATISGNHSFVFSLQYERRSDTNSLSQTGILVASAKTQTGHEFPVKYEWHRKIGEHLVEISGVEKHTYNVSADDVGMHIVCYAIPQGDPTLGIACGTIGPFQLDPISRMSLDGHIAAKSHSFPASHLTDETDSRPRDLQIHITQDYVKVTHPGSDRQNREVLVPYSADYPRVKLHPRNVVRFRLELAPDFDKIYKFQALSRSSRDAIVLLLSAFRARKYIATNFILSRLYQNPATPGAPLTAVEATEEFDIVPVSERLEKELDRTLTQLALLEKVVGNAKLEKSELQAQLHETIASYTEAIECLHAQLASAQGGPSASLQVQLHESRSNQSKLQLELQEYRQKTHELEQELAAEGAANRQAAAAAAAAAEDGGRAAATGEKKSLPAELESMQVEIQQLRTRISSLAGDQLDLSKWELTRQEELRRLRADVEMLHGEKEALETNCLQADKEKAELIENFSFVKGCLDELQMASLSTPAASAEHEREVAQMKAAHNQVMEERNRLAQKVDSLDRERERQKHQREGTLERVMSVNARLLEARDKLERERTRLSQLYESTISSMGAVGAARVAMHASATAASSGPAPHPSEADAASCSANPFFPGDAETNHEEDYLKSYDMATLRALQLELENTQVSLAKAEEEGNSLRSRLRKLASV